ncbi:MAG: UDP-N-acetylmuramoyl-L-alanine--D-glutamate ligase, partial [Patescibacteria group bacterium]
MSGLNDEKKASGHVLHGVEVLVMGLGLHGGGEATVKWLLKRGGKVTVTDTRAAKTLAPSLRALRGLPIRFVLGRHRASDFRAHDIIVVNPGVCSESKYLRTAKRAGKRIENVASLFFGSIDSPVVGVTGTRGKTTTTLWIAELLKKKYKEVRQSGTPENALLEELERIRKKNVPAVVELSSWQLELLPQSDKAPHIAGITNIYPDHLNRYRDVKAYADAKANIFLHQHAGDMLVLNYDDLWHRYFLKKKPKSALYYISRKILPKKLDGAYVRSEKMILRVGGKEQTLFSVARFRKEYGEHNLENLLRAVLMAKLFDLSAYGSAQTGPKLRITERDVLSLTTPRMRQETIYKKGRLTVINDSCATSPDGVIAAIERFRNVGDIVLIAGG